jgi:hypothetical protein
MATMTRPKLSQERIVAAGVAAAGCTGIDRLSLREPAKLLHVRTATLADLVDLAQLKRQVATELTRSAPMVDCAGELPARLQTWAGATRTWFIDIRGLAGYVLIWWWEVPWACENLERLLGVMVGAGVGEGDQLDLALLVLEYVLGSAAVEDACRPAPLPVEAELPEGPTVERTDPTSGDTREFVDGQFTDGLGRVVAMIQERMPVPGSPRSRSAAVGTAW